MRTGHARAAIVGAVTLAMTMVQAPVGATAEFSVERIAGDSRYATAAAIATDAFPSTTGAIIATGESFPDALAASFIAGYVNSPILLVERNRVPESTQAALTELGVEEVVILGGSAAVSEQVQATLAETYEVVRLSGQDRFATAANIALAVNPGDVGEINGKRTAFLAYGYSYADALAVGPLAFAGRFPILLNGSAGLGTPARVAIDRLDIDHVVIVGGTGVISDAARREIEDMGVSTERLRGIDRFATASAVADFALNKLQFIDDHVNLVRGVDPSNPLSGFADALAGSVHAGREMAPLLLTHPTELSLSTHVWLEDHADTLATGDILGGASAVSDGVRRAMVAAARRVAGEITAFDLVEREYSYLPDGATQARVIGYAPDEAFAVDGDSATIDEFEAALTVGDRVRFTTAAGASHRLVNAD